MTKLKISELLKQQKEMSNVSSLIEAIKNSVEYQQIVDVTHDIEIISDEKSVQLIANLNNTCYKTKFSNQKTISYELELLKSKCMFFVNVNKIANRPINIIEDMSIIEYNSSCCICYQYDYTDIEFTFYKRQICALVSNEKYSEMLLINGYKTRKQYVGDTSCVKELIVDLDCDLIEPLSL